MESFTRRQRSRRIVYEGTKDVDYRISDGRFGLQAEIKCRFYLVKFHRSRTLLLIVSSWERQLISVAYIKNINIRKINIEDFYGRKLYATTC